MNFLRDLLNLNELVDYVMGSWATKVNMVRSKLDAKLKEDPNYEVFVPFVYFKQTFFADKICNGGVVISSITLISNKGNVIVKSGDRYSPMSNYVGSRGYVRATVVVEPNGPRFKALVHRALGCLFVPIPEELGVNAHPSDFYVNHKNGIKTDYELDNLEWCTNQGNMDHATENKLMKSGIEHYATKPVAGLVLKGDFKGYKFLLFGDKDMTANGFINGGVSRVCLGKREYHKHCSFSFATEEQIATLPRRLPEEVKNNLNSTHSRVLSYILATKIGTQETILIKGGKPELIKLGFDQSSVSKVINGKKKSHKGYTFKRIIN